MSKILKSFDFSTDTNRIIKPVLKSKQSVQLSSIPASSKSTISRQDSLQSKILLVSNCSSINIKHKNQPLTSISPNRPSKASPLRNLSESLIKFPKRGSTCKSVFESKEILTDKNPRKPKDENQLELKLNQKISSLKSSKSLDYINIFRDFFIEVIQKNKSFSSVLIKIKEGYEEYIKHLQDSTRVPELQFKLNQLEVELRIQKDLHKTCERKIESLSKENFEISKDLERSEKICTQLEEKFYSINRFDCADTPKDELKWKAVLLENSQIYESLKKQAEELKNYKFQEKKLIELISVLKQKGYPVEEVYESEILNSKNGHSHASSLSSNSEAENLLSSRPFYRKKPSIIPDLDLLQVSPESVSAYSNASLY